MTNIAERLNLNCQIDPDSGCWLWQRATDKDGYGLTKVDGKMRRAHRVSYELFKGPLTPGLVLDHLCQVKRCINPEHLEEVTNAENMRRARKSHCKWGHPYVSRWTTKSGSSQPLCLVCRCEAQRRWRSRRSDIT